MLNMVDVTVQCSLNVEHGRCYCSVFTQCGTWSMLLFSVHSMWNMVDVTVQCSPNVEHGRCYCPVFTTVHAAVR